jgi:hypothetical protein
MPATAFYFSLYKGTVMQRHEKRALPPFHDLQFHLCVLEVTMADDLLPTCPKIATIFQNQTLMASDGNSEIPLNWAQVKLNFSFIKYHSDKADPLPSTDKHPR